MKNQRNQCNAHKIRPRLKSALKKLASEPHCKGVCKTMYILRCLDRALEVGVVDEFFEYIKRCPDLVAMKETVEWPKEIDV